MQPIVIENSDEWRTLVLEDGSLFRLLLFFVSVTQSQSKSLAGPRLGNGGQGVALTLQDGVIVRGEIAKFDAAAETAGCADHAIWLPVNRKGALSLSTVEPDL